jgi:hypothetical protein
MPPSSTERFLEIAAAVVGKDAAQQAQRSAKRHVRALIKLLKVAALMLAAGIVIPVAMITGGILLGPKGYEGLVIAPLSVLLAWAGILFFAYRSRPTPRAITRSSLPQLPANTEEWLEQQRASLPRDAQGTLDAITERLSGMRPQVARVAPQHPGAGELRRLLAEELPELVRGYQKVPRELRQKPLHGGPSPDQRLVEGLTTIDAQLARLHEKLAADDLYGLATQQRYLELKYKDDKK